MIYVVHHTDQDGYGAAATVKLWLQQRGLAAQFYPYNYTNNDDMPDFTDKTVIFVDCGLQPFSEMKKRVIDKCKQLIWIDHHPNNIEAANKARIDQKKNIKTFLSTDRCATYLTWKFFYKTQPPDIIALIDDYDRGILAQKEQSVPLCFMLNLLDKPKHLNMDFWKTLLVSNQAPQLIQYLVDKGKVVEFVYKKELEDLINNGVMVNFEGHDTLVGNGDIKTILFSVYPDLVKASIYMTWHVIGDKVSVSLFSYTVNVGKLATKYKGGGHERAAGFTMTLREWSRLMSNLLKSKG